MINTNCDLKIQTDNQNQELSETTETCKCKMCRRVKNIINFHKLQIKSNEHILGEFYFTGICKNCIPEECLMWNIYSKKVIINQKLFNEYFLIKQKDDFFKKHNISINNLIQRPKALQILNQTDKNWIKEKVAMGLIQEFSFISGMSNYLEGQQNNMVVIENKYYLPQEIEMLKNICETGELRVRTSPAIKNGREFIHNPPYTIQGKKHQYIFTNLHDQKRVCGFCLEYKNFNEFYKSNVSSNGIGTMCIACQTEKNNKYYQNLPPDTKKEYARKTREWAKNNKDKIKLYRRSIKRKKTLTGKIRNKLKKRLKKVVEGANNQTWREWIEKQTNKSYFLDNTLGISTIDFIKYIESKWLPGMNWDNYGNSGYEKDENGNYIYENGKLKEKIGWEIDHIKPLSSFNLTNPEEVKKANYYTNLLPMWWKDNNSKSDRVELDPEFDQEFLSKYKELEILIKKKDNNSNDRYENMLEMQTGEEFI